MHCTKKNIITTLLKCFTIILVLTGCHKQVFISYEKTENQVLIKTLTGSLAIYPLADNAVRVMFYETKDTTTAELVFTNDYKVPGFEVPNK